MRKFFKIRTARFGLASVIGGVAAWNIGDYLDAGRIEQIVAAKQPLYMNEPAQMLIVFGGLAALFGLMALFSALCDHLEIPVCALGIDR